MANANANISINQSINQSVLARNATWHLQIGSRNDMHMKICIYKDKREKVEGAAHGCPVHAYRKIARVIDKAWDGEGELGAQGSVLKPRTR